jgi:hypothetical protein
VTTPVRLSKKNMSITVSITKKVSRDFTLSVNFTTGAGVFGIHGASGAG